MTAGRKVNTSSHHWNTPPLYVEAVKTVFGGGIALDPCSNVYSIVGAGCEYLLPATDGLKAPWTFPTIFVNPPYGGDKERGTTIKDWLRRCVEAHRAGSEVIALIPAAPNTSHWKQFVWGAASAICFLYDTRLKFLVAGEAGGKGAPMACAVAYWGHNPERFSEVFSKFGAVTLKWQAPTPAPLISAGQYPRRAPGAGARPSARDLPA